MSETLWNRVLSPERGLPSPAAWVKAVSLLPLWSGQSPPLWAGWSWGSREDKG